MSRPTSVESIRDRDEEMATDGLSSGMVRGVAKAGDIDESDMNTMFQTNVTGLINMTQAVLAIYKKRPDGGAGDIINVGSIAGREPYPGGSIYCATKSAVRSFTDAMRRELIATRIRVMEVDPGQVETEFSIVRFGGDKAKADAVYAGCEPLTPDDIAEIIVFAAGRRENVVLADSLVFPNHQVSFSFSTYYCYCYCELMSGTRLMSLKRLLPRSCIGNHRSCYLTLSIGWDGQRNAQEACNNSSENVDIGFLRCTDSWDV